MILVTHEARAAAEQARLQSEGLAPAVAEKRRKKDRARMSESDAHSVAEGALGNETGEDEDCVPVDELPGVGKGYEHVGISDGPGDPVMPGQISPQDFRRPYVSDGHGALSPSAGPPNVPSVDLRGDRGTARPLSPHAPIPVEGPE